ncbi:MAG: hypothetical protein WC900_04565 [Oscillospiraceae bacterium]|jgi:hypothetical protein
MEKLKSDQRKIRTTIDIKVALKDFAEEKQDFTTQDAVAEIREKLGETTFLNNNRTAQLLRSTKTHEFNERLKKWVKIRQ